MSEAAGKTEAPLNVFISYSRKDSAAAEHLRAKLAEQKFEAYLDTHDILPGEAWQDRLTQLIVSADTVVFLISPDSVSSSVCDWEVNEAERLGKRLLPVVIRDSGPEAVPQRLKRLNYVFLRNEAEEGEGIAKLRAALLSDIDWIRNHTRLSELAEQWAARGRRADLLLRGSALSDAERWLGSRPSEAPEPTRLQRDYIDEGRRAEHAAMLKERASLRAMKRLLQAVVGLLVAAIAVLVAFLNQRMLLEQYVWHLRMRPAVLALDKERQIMAKPGSDFSECEHGCPSMVVVPAGDFMMGATPSSDQPPNQLPRHKVTIARPFAVGRSEVTFGEWEECWRSGACPQKSDSRMGQKDQPVITVSWDDARIYVTWLSKVTGQSYRLLSEAEWEYAARGITNAVQPYPHYPWGEEIGMNNANCSGCGSPWDAKSTAPVRSFKPNAFGLYDMHGNVWEWVEDGWHPNYEGAPSDGSAWIIGGQQEMRALRGGSFTDGPQLLVSQVRNGTFDVHRYENIGFRVARTLRSEAP